MRQLCLVALLCVSLSGFSQSLNYDTTFQVNTGTQGTWKAKVHLPPTYYQVTDSFQCILFFMGAGEGCATNFDTLAYYGPHARLAGGWDGGVPLANGTHYPIIISVSQCPKFDVNELSSGLITIVLNRYRIKRNSVHISGWSAGGNLCKLNATADTYDGEAPYGPFTYADKFKSILDVQGPPPDDNPTWRTSIKNFPRNKWGGKYLGLWGTADGERNIQVLADSINKAVPNAATVIKTADSHSTTAVARFFGDRTTSPDVFTINGIAQTAYQWALRNGDTTLTSNGNVLPVVNAGADQSLFLPANSITLSGTASDADGTIATYVWTQVSGPVATIATPSSNSTVISGLTEGVYLFRLTVADNQGATAYDEVQVTVNAACTTPIAHAGADQTILRTKGFTRLNGSSSVNATTYAWTRIDTTMNKSFGNLVTPTKAITDVMILPYGTFGYYDFELTASNACGTAKDTVRVNIDWGVLPPQRTTLRLATSADADTIPNCNVGDLVIDGANDGSVINGKKTAIYVSKPLSSTKLGPGQKVLIKAGKYGKIQLIFDSLQVVGTSANPVIITSYGGQLECTALSVKNVVNTRITGKYRPDTSGNINYRGHENGNYAFSNGKYGIYVNNNWESLAGFGLEIAGANSDSVEIEYCEIANGNFSGMVIKENAGLNDFDGFKIHDNYIHDIHGEGMYLGSTGSDPQHQLNGWRIYNNRLFNCGNEIIQFGQQGHDNLTDHNVFVGSATNWKSPFEDTQDFGAQAGVRNGKNTHRDNLHLGTGEQFINFFAIAKSSIPSNNDTIHYSNNLFLHSKGFIGNYFGGTAAPIANLTIAIDSNYFGRFDFKANEVFTDARATNTAQIIRAVPVVGRFLLRNNWRDDTKSTFISFVDGYGTPNLDSVNNNVTTISNPLFVNSGFVDTFRFETLTRWNDTLYRTWKDEYTNLPGTRVGEAISYQAGELVSFLSKIYKSKAGSNHGHMPQGVTDDYWELQYWINGSDTSYAPPNDFRLRPGDPYRNRHMGLLDLYGDTIPPVTKGDTINVNLYGGTNPYNNTAWNNWTTPSTETNNVVSAAFNYSNGTASTVTGTLSYVAGVSDNGASYGGTVCPPEVLRYASYATSNNTLTLSNLTAGRTYNLELYASRSNTGNATVFAIGGLADTIVTDANKTNAAIFTNLTPDVNNRIVISMSRYGGSYHYLNGFRLIANTSSARQATTASAAANGAVMINPNPTSNSIWLNYTSAVDGKLLLRITDISGRTVKTITTEKKGTQLLQSIDVQSLVSGVYYLEVISAKGGKVVKPFVKQ